MAGDRAGGGPPGPGQEDQADRVREEHPRL